MSLGMSIAQVLLILVIGLWLAARFKESPIVKFFGRNDWFVGAFLALIGFMNFETYAVDYVKNMNLVIVIIGLILILFSVFDLARK